MTRRMSMSCRFVSLWFAVFLVCGCGYTTRSLLSPDFKGIHVENFKNSISVASEQTNERMYKGYRPGLEIDVTKAVIDRFLLDGNLKIASPKEADLILSGELMDFKKDGLRYDRNNNVEEYRIKLIVNLQLKDAGSGKVLWQESGFAGEATYRTSGSRAVSENASLKDATQDLARRVVERTVEGW